MAQTILLSNISVESKSELTLCNTEHYSELKRLRIEYYHSFDRPAANITFKNAIFALIFQSTPICPTIMVSKWQSELRKRSEPEKVKIFERFFKSGPGEYGEGDSFIGISVPDNRSISRHYSTLPYDQIATMIDHPIHEFRLAGFLALVQRYKSARRPDDQEAIARQYISTCHKANNWDLVDLSAPYIIGKELTRGRCIDDIRLLADSQNLWERRVAVVSTLTAIRSGDLDIALEMCDRSINMPHPLMRKAVGWVLRECGKKDRSRLEQFLNDHIATISSVTLSYAIEHFSTEERLTCRNKRKTAQQHTLK